MSKFRRFAIHAIALAALALVAVIGAANAAPKAEPWPRWEKQDAASTKTIDHAAWDSFVKTYVVASSDGINRVAYGRVSAGDKQALSAYVDRLAATSIGAFSRAEQLPYWINLYNATTVKVIVDHYPVKSIRDIKISPGLFSSGPWGKKLVAVEGEPLALDDIEHRILRPIWRDPRIHYAVNCASIGCPNLAREAYTVATADRMLTEGARLYINHSRGARFDGAKLAVSSIYVWFKEDFGNNDAGVIAHLRHFAQPALAERLAAAKSLDSDAYDWALNEARE